MPTRTTRPSVDAYGRKQAGSPQLLLGTRHTHRTGSYALGSQGIWTNWHVHRRGGCIESLPAQFVVVVSDFGAGKSGTCKARGKGGRQQLSWTDWLAARHDGFCSCLLLLEVVCLVCTTTHFLRRLSWTTHSTLSHRQLPHGAPSTTSQRTLRARHDTHARAARFLVTFAVPCCSDVDAVRFLDDEDGGVGVGVVVVVVVVVVVAVAVAVAVAAVSDRLGTVVGAESTVDGDSGLDEESESAALLDIEEALKSKVSSSCRWPRCSSEGFSFRGGGTGEVVEVPVAEGCGQSRSLLVSS
jgi:hypothetical protein